MAAVLSKRQMTEEDIKLQFPGIDRTSVLLLLFPLPPLTEQNRIVQRIEELLPLVKGL